MTNYEFLQRLTPEEFANLFVLLRYDGAEKSDWLEWMEEPAYRGDWEKILKGE